MQRRRTALCILRGAVVTGTQGASRTARHRRSRCRWGEADRADCLAVSGGWNPTLHLACHPNSPAGLPDWDERLAAFVPRAGAVPGPRCGRAAAGAFSTHAALHRRRRGGCRGAGRARGRRAGARSARPRTRPWRSAPSGRFPRRRGAPGRFQNDVTTKGYRAGRAGEFPLGRAYEALYHARDGDRPGRSPGTAGLAITAGLTGRSVAETGTTGFRPPSRRCRSRRWARAAMGPGLAPRHYPPAHRRSRRAARPSRGRALVPAELPTRQGKAGKACDREVMHVGRPSASAM